MRQMFLSSAMVVTFLFTPQIVVAEEPEKGGPPGPEMLFRHLDANHDGVISEDEMPADAPAPFKTLLKAADKNGDKNVSQEEFTAALKEHPLPRPPFGMRGEPGQPPCPMDGMPGGMMPPFPPGAPGMGFAPHGPQGSPHGEPQGKAPDLKALFEKFDKDKDGKLTPAEFTEGMEQLHKAIDFRRDGKALDARIEALEAKLKAVEAKLEGK